MRNLLVIAILIIVGIGGFFILQNPSPGPESKIIVKHSGGIKLLIPECFQKSSLTEMADYIVEGIVNKVESRKWNEDETNIFTYSDLQIEKYVKGSPFTGDKLQIVTLGGTVGEMTEAGEDEPIFHQGKKVRIYVKKTEGEFSILCTQMGVEEVEEIGGQTSSSGITGKVTLGPICPLEGVSSVKDCADRPDQQGFNVLTVDQERRVVATFQSNTKGEFRVAVPPGSYFIVSKNKVEGPSCNQFEFESVKVEAGEFTNITIRCDTGIR